MITTTITTTNTWNMFYDTFLFLNAFVHVPAWSVLLNIIVIATIGYYTYPIVSLRYTIMLYLSYCALDRNAGSPCTFLSQRTIERLRHYIGFKYVSKYFPASLIKTVDITPEQGPYIFLYLPHGIISMGVNTSINTNACQFDTMFPGIVRWAVTLNVNFRVPLWREWIHMLGFVCADKNVLVSILQQRRQSIVLVPGGAMEAIYTGYDSFKLIDRRRGFIRLALQTNAKIVPIIGFGENRTFRVAPIPSPGTVRHRIQQVLCKVLTFSTPILLSPFPQRTPLNAVVGSPIEFDHPKDVTSEYVDLCYQRYKDAVTKLYNDHKHRYGYENIELEWVTE